MKILAPVLALALVAIIVYAYYYIPTSAGPVGDGKPNSIAGGWRYWTKKTFLDPNGGFTGMKKLPGQYTQGQCFEQADAMDSSIGSATHNPRNGGECYLWKASSTKQAGGDANDTSYSRAFRKLPW